MDVRQDYGRCAGSIASRTYAVQTAACSADEWLEFFTASAKAARHWRDIWGYQGREGIVIVIDREVQAWVYELGYAERWQPGSLAIDEAGASWTALGHNGAGGAVMWLPNDIVMDTSLST